MLSMGTMSIRYACSMLCRLLAELSAAATCMRTIGEASTPAAAAARASHTRGVNNAACAHVRARSKVSTPTFGCPSPLRRPGKHVVPTWEDDSKGTKLGWGGGLALPRRRRLARRLASLQQRRVLARTDGTAAHGLSVWPLRRTAIALVRRHHRVHQHHSAAPQQAAGGRRRGGWRRGSRRRDQLRLRLRGAAFAAAAPGVRWRQRHEHVRVCAQVVVQAPAAPPARPRRRRRARRRRVQRVLHAQQAQRRYDSACTGRGVPRCQGKFVKNVLGAGRVPSSRCAPRVHGAWGSGRGCGNLPSAPFAASSIL